MVAHKTRCQAMEVFFIMKTREQLSVEIQSHLKAARDICDLAEREKRDFTGEERAEVQAHLGKARLLKDQIKQLEPEDVREAKQRAQDVEIVRQTADMFGEIDSTSRGDGSGRSDRKGAGAWSKAFMDQRSRNGQKELLTPSGNVGVPSLSSTVPAIGERLETILQVLRVTPLTTSSVEYLREQDRSHRAAAVADKGIKPTSTYELIEIDAPAQTIAHLTEPIPRRYLDDQQNLRRYLDTVLRQGLFLALENEVVNGNGISPSLDGMLNVSGRSVVVPDGSSDDFALARRGITVLELQSLPIDHLVFCIHPNTWESFELAEKTGGGYILNQDSKPSPINRQRRQLWGVPVAPSVAVPEDRLLLLHQAAVELYEREGVSISWSENSFSIVELEPVSDFARNLIRFRAEGRWVLAIYNPAAIVEISLDAGS